MTVIIAKDDDLETFETIMPNAVNMEPTMVKVYSSILTEKNYVVKSSIPSDYMRVSRGSENYAKLLAENQHAGINVFNGKHGGINVFNGKHGGINVKEYCANIMEKSYDGVKGKDVIDWNVMACINDDILKHYSPYLLAKYIKVTESEMRELSIASIFSKRRNILARSRHEMLNFLGYVHGIDLNNKNAGMILTSLRKVKNDALRKDVAAFYNNTNYEKAIVDLEKHLVQAEKQETDYGKALYLALNMENYESWKKVFKNKPLTEINLIVKLLEGYHGRRVDDKIIFYKDMDIGGDVLEKLIKLNILKGICKVEPSMENGKMSSCVHIQI